MYFVMLVFISVIALIGIWQRGMYFSNDGEVHVARLAQFTLALEDGHFPVRWLKNWFNGYGYPLFVFNYSLPYYFGALIRWLTGLSFINVFKLLMVISLALSGVTQFYFLRQSSNQKAAFIGSLFFIFAPYRFADIYHRAALGEVLAFIFIPLLFLLPHLIKKQTRFMVVITALVVAGFILTHLITFLLFLPFWFAYTVLIFKKALAKYSKLVQGVAFGVLLSAFQWLPLIFERSYTIADRLYLEIYKGHFLSPYQFIKSDSPIQFGLADSTIFIAAVIMTVTMVLKKKKTDKYLVFFIITIVIASFLTLDWSRPLWNLFKPIQYLVFPWRYLTYIVFSCSFLAAYAVSKLSLTPKATMIIVFLMSLIAIYPSRHFLKPINFELKNDDYYVNYHDPRQLEKYFLPKDFSAELISESNSTISIISGQATIVSLDKKTAYTKAVVNVDTPAKIQLHTLYFPGWRLKIDGKTEKFAVESGLMNVFLASGAHSLEWRFGETKIRLVANLISFLAIIIFLYLFFQKVAIRQILPK